MQYDFSPEDRRLYQFLEGSNLFLDIQNFLEYHTERIRNAFEQMLKDMENQAETDWNRKVIRELDRDQFVDVVKFTFCVMSARSILELYVKHQQNQLAILTAKIWVTEMRENPQDERHILLVDKAIEQCKNAIRQEYNKEPQS